MYRATANRPVDPEFDKRRDQQQYELRVTRLDQRFGEKVVALFEEQAKAELWKGTAAARSAEEYWAAGVEAYFDASGVVVAPNTAEVAITTRERLKAHDPKLYDLVHEVMAFGGKREWRVR
jgi:hypothetical protein